MLSCHAMIWSGWSFEHSSPNSTFPHSRCRNVHIDVPSLFSPCLQSSGNGYHIAAAAVVEMQGRRWMISSWVTDLPGVVGADAGVAAVEPLVAAVACVVVASTFAVATVVVVIASLVAAVDSWT